MGQLLPDGRARRVRRSDALIAFGLALGAELALATLPPGQHLLVDGVPADASEVRGLPQGTHTMLVVNDAGSILYRHLVLLGADERVVIDPKQLVSPEVFRGPVPDRTAPDLGVESLPQMFVVGAIEREAVRVHVDGASVPFDVETQTYRVELQPGPHTLERYVAGGRRAPYPFEVRGKPWQCAVGRTGDVKCVEIPPLAADAPQIEVGPTRELLSRTPPHKRIDVIKGLQGTLSCIDVTAILADFIGDDARLEVALLLRPLVRDPWNVHTIRGALSFPDAERMVTAMYAGAPPSSGTQLPE
jgi:hypothetical protein